MDSESNKELLTKTELTFGLVAERMKSALELGTDSELAALLGMSTSNFANRKRVESFPFDRLIPLCISRSVSIDWVCTGVGHPFTSGKPANFAQVPAVNPVLLAQVMAELEGAFGHGDTVAFARKLGMLVGIVYNQVAGERDHKRQAEKLREQAQLLASVDKVTSELERSGPQGTSQPRRRRR